MTEESRPHQRRKRYKGKNPRRFEERYKELNPAAYPEEAEHIMAKGNTLAGSHRPICVKEILSILDPKPAEIALDATLGYGGHAQELLGCLLPGGRLFGIDADPLELSKTQARLRLKGFEEDVLVVRQMNFSAVRSLLFEAGGGFDCVLADLGVSSMQLDNPSRGFSHKTEGPLDLRLNPRRGKSAASLLSTIDREPLVRLLQDHADEPYAEEIAQAMTSPSSRPTTTTELAGLIKVRLKRLGLEEQEIKKSLQRSFMALRIEVNQEFEELERFLRVLPQCMNPGARVAILTFHSGEDRRVKKSFAMAEQRGIYSKIASKPLRPSAEECRSNPRASCAKLRWAVRSELALS